MSKIDHSLFSANQQALESAYGRCPQCDSQLAMKYGKAGAFLGCAAYPECDFSKPLQEYQESTVKLIEGSQCPLCSQSLAVKRGRYGLFIGCSDFPQCHHIEKLSQAAAPEPAQQVDCPACKPGLLVKRSNKFGKTFYACDQFPRCKFALNAEPVAQPCPTCGYGVLQKRQHKGQTMLFCANKGCTYKSASDTI